MRKLARRPVEVEHRTGAVVVEEFRESSLITLARVGALTSIQVDAAFRLANLASSASTDIGRRVTEYVDGGESTPRAELATDALRELRRVRQLLGRKGYELAIAVCVKGRAVAPNNATRRQRDTASDNLREHLDELAALWHLDR